VVKKIVIFHAKQVSTLMLKYDHHVPLVSWKCSLVHDDLLCYTLEVYVIYLVHMVNIVSIYLLIIYLF
jgi:hypothetical protein